MKETISYAMIWIACALAISFAIYITKSAYPLWTFIFPAIITHISSDKEAEKG